MSELRYQAITTTNLKYDDLLLSIDWLIQRFRLEAVQSQEHQGQNSKLRWTNERLAKQADDQALDRASLLVQINDLEEILNKERASLALERKKRAERSEKKPDRIKSLQMELANQRKAHNMEVQDLGDKMNNQAAIIRDLNLEIQKFFTKTKKQTKTIVGHYAVTVALSNNAPRRFAIEAMQKQLPYTYKSKLQANGALERGPVRIFTGNKAQCDILAETLDASKMLVQVVSC